MSTATKPLADLIQELPPALQLEVRDFVEFLLTRRERTADQRLRQDWAGALQEYQQEYTSVELQHLALDWRSE
jgi:uncharacterized protein DUF2281